MENKIIQELKEWVELKLCQEKEYLNYLKLPDSLYLKSYLSFLQILKEYPALKDNIRNAEEHIDNLEFLLKQKVEELSKYEKEDK